ncbi:polymer-forming cytoskeletal protein [bacterium]|nr:polymer-forming cytoskeletal protein [bacterium]
MDNSTQQSLISADVEIKGTIRSGGSVRVDGKLDGELHCTSDAVIGKDAKIKGNLNVNAISVEGTVTGNITAKDRIELKASARVTGDIKAKRLTVEDGVTFVGRSEVNPSGQPISPPVTTEEKPSTAAEAIEDEDAAAGAALKSFARR